MIEIEAVKYFSNINTLYAEIRRSQCYNATMLKCYNAKMLEIEAVNYFSNNKTLNADLPGYIVQAGIRRSQIEAAVNF